MFGDIMVVEFARALFTAGRINVTLTVATFPLMLMVGGLIAVLRSIPFRPLNFLLGVYVDAIRATPLLLHLFFVFFGLPMWGIRFDAWTSALVMLTLHFAAYQSVVFRSAVSSVPKSVREASMALGIEGFTCFRRVTVPLAFRIALPPTANMLVDLFRGTAIVSLLAVQDIVFKGTIMLQTYKGDSPTIFLIIALFFVAVGYPMSMVVRLLERKFAIL